MGSWDRGFDVGFHIDTDDGMGWRSSAPIIGPLPMSPYAARRKTVHVCPLIFPPS